MRKHRQNSGTGILIILMFNMGMITSTQAQNGWERMPEMPTSRAVFKSVLHDGKIYAIGGLKSVHPPYGITTEVYDTETGEWSVMASMENPCSGLSVEILNNKIYVIGGVYSTKQQYTVIQEYDIEMDTWSTKCTMPEPRFNHISEVIDGKIYIAGGLTVDENGSHPGLTSARVYDPVNDQWDTIADLHHERFFGRSCVFNNKIYVFGGAPAGVPYRVAHQSIEIYDPDTDVWTISEDEIPIPYMAGMVQVYGESILLFGGCRIILDKENYSSIYKYVPDAPEDKWKEMASMPVKRGVMAGNIVDHYLHMIGGFDGFQNNELEIAQDNHWRLDLDFLKEYVFIPDTVFLHALIDEGVDTNGDSLISFAEAEAVISLNVEYGSSELISDLSGIEAFINLDSLNCSRNRLTSLDVSGCTRLKYLKCGDTYSYFGHANRLTNLDLTNNTALTYLECSQNYLTSLNLSNNTALTYLGCQGNYLTSLDLTDNTSLKLLNCSGNNLASLDLSNNEALEYLYFFENQLSNLDLSNNFSLVKLNCSGNNLTSLDLSTSETLEKLSCFGNQLTSLNLAGCIAITELYCDNNNLTSLKLTDCIALTGMDCSDNNLTSLDISNNKALTFILLNDMPTLFEVCVWITPFPIDGITFSSHRSSNVYFTTECSDYISPDITAVDNLFQPDYIEATSSEDGMIYLVDEETDKDIVAIQEVCIDSVEAVANTPVNISLSGLNNGIYWLYASDTAGNISEPEAFTIMGVRIDQTRYNSYRIYPNPTNNLLTIETEQPYYRSIDITSLNGQLLHNIRMEGTSQQIDLSTFNKGVYFITIRSKDYVTTEKIIML